ncbi:MAG TPA: hypothetical protein VKZ82_28570 [Nonomuraea sp.]|nr:hypothetical protein [Nonomuraea sp.]
MNTSQADTVSQRDLVVSWWKRQTPESRERLLALDEDDYLPFEQMTSLVQAGIPVGSAAFWSEIEPGPAGFLQPTVLRDFLVGQREKSA